MRRKLALFLLLSILFVIPVQAVTVHYGETVLAKEDVRLEAGVTWVRIRAVAEACNLSISWDGRQATIGGVVARPGDTYISAQGRYFPVQQVRLQNGSVWLPIRALASALGATVDWHGPTQTVTLGKIEGIQSAENHYDAEDLEWLSRIIHAESRGEPLLGKIAVGNVVLARVASSEFPNTIYDVIFDTRYGVQFTPIKDGSIYLTPSEESIRAAKLCLEGAEAARGCLFFFNPDRATSTWISENRVFAVRIGAHEFYY